MRDKLIELLSENFVEFCNVQIIAGNAKISAVTIDAEKFADHLIANGVTLQKWIPVKEPPKEGTYFVVDEYGYVFTAFYWKEKRWWLRDGRRAHPTHWNTIQLSAPTKENE